MLSLTEAAVPVLVPLEPEPWLNPVCVGLLLADVPEEPELELVEFDPGLRPTPTPPLSPGTLSATVAVEEEDEAVAVEAPAVMFRPVSAKFARTVFLLTISTVLLVAALLV